MCLRFLDHHNLREPRNKPDRQSCVQFLKAQKSCSSLHPNVAPSCNITSKMEVLPTPAAPSTASLTKWMLADSSSYRPGELSTRS